MIATDIILYVVKVMDGSLVMVRSSLFLKMNGLSIAKVECISTYIHYMCDIYLTFIYISTPKTLLIDNSFLLRNRENCKWCH